MQLQPNRAGKDIMTLSSLMQYQLTDSTGGTNVAALAGFGGFAWQGALDIGTSQVMPLCMAKVRRMKHLGPSTKTTGTPHWIDTGCSRGKRTQDGRDNIRKGSQQQHSAGQLAITIRSAEWSKL
ncbi:hypothetical protein HYALB_00012911 [Hymenoscyphus albidus]|uniref:Uncharacterized protein n=1 Tax=Hymenoscyphus albidus TaxID=595503 RepID=A0A9N9QAK4_9HELO|nr:hypothetical protein HYALB_00012911 [Hymenoscyphus albidus]